MKTRFLPSVFAIFSILAYPAENRAEAPIPNQTFEITLSGEPVTVERYGTGPTAIIFFGYWPFTIKENLKWDYGSEFASLLGNRYSMFLWDYPMDGPTDDQVFEALFHFYDSLGEGDPFEKRPDLSGQATSVVTQILARTGLSDVCLVGNSFGAGALLWDFAALAKDPRKRFILISPTEVFMPPNPPLASPLPRTVLVADAELDFPLVLTQEVVDYIDERTTAQPPGYEPGQDAHFIIGGPLVSLSYVFDLANLTPTITSKTKISGAVGKAFNYRIQASGPPTRYSATRLPGGLRLNATTGVISGQPQRAGTFQVPLSAANASGTATASLTVVIGKGTQTVRFSPAKTQRFKKGRTFKLSANASSRLKTTFVSSNPKILSIKGNRATIHRKGKVTVTAQQRGNANYRPAKLAKGITIK